MNEFVYVMSDFHLHDEEQPFLFTPEKEEVFAMLAAQIAEDGELVLDGDIFDLTGMTPPHRGLDAFFAALFTPEELATTPVLRDAMRRRAPDPGVFARLRARFPSFFRALGALAKDGRLGIVPGNHDWQLADPAWQRALAAELATSAGARPSDVKLDVFTQSFAVGSTLLAIHGNQFDAANATDHGGDNQGAALTWALYNAVMPALQAFGVDRDAVFAIPAVRPEENVVLGLEQLVPRDRLSRLLRAFVALLDANGYFAGSAVPEFLRETFATPSMVVSQLKDDGGLPKELKQIAHDAVLGHKRLSSHPGAPDVVVMGHTHVLDGSKSYVNLGTWIDHVEGITEGERMRRDRTLPVLRVPRERGVAQLHDVQQLPWKKRVERCAVLWKSVPAKSA